MLDASNESQWEDADLLYIGKMYAVFLTIYQSSKVIAKEPSSCKLMALKHGNKLITVIIYSGDW